MIDDDDDMVLPWDWDDDIKAAITDDDDRVRNRSTGRDGTITWVDTARGHIRVLWDGEQNQTWHDITEVDAIRDDTTGSWDPMWIREMEAEHWIRWLCRDGGPAPARTRRIVPWQVALVVAVSLLATCLPAVIR